MKTLFRRIHLYLAFGAGLVIMTTCFTGAVLVFEEELQHLFHKERYFVQPGLAARPIEEIISSLEKKEPAALINVLKIYTDSSRTIEVSYTLIKDEGIKTGQSSQLKVVPSKIKQGAKDNIRLIAFVNPYTTEVIEIYNHRDSFFSTMMSLHRRLLGGDTGKLIVGICTLIFLFILFTGIILWWPKNRNILEQRLKMKWKGGWKRVNHDLHIVFGFYSALFLFILAFTGLGWSFAWFNKGIYKVTNSSMQQPKPPAVVSLPNAQTLSFDEVLQCIKSKVNSVKYYNISAPKDSISPYTISVLPFKASHESAVDFYYVNRYEPVIMQYLQYGDRNLGQRVRTIFKPIHTAAIWGTPSKIIGLIVCILGVIFPVTGYIMWWQRINKASNRKVKQNNASNKLHEKTKAC